MNGTTYYQQLGNINSNTVKYFNNENLKLSDFVVNTLTVSDFSPSGGYYDADGDVVHPTTPFTMGTRRFEWRDREGALITNYNQQLGGGCGKKADLKLPLTLKITLPNVRAVSRYGTPRYSAPADLVKTYKIGASTGFCYVKPNAMYVYPNHVWLNASVGDWQTGSSRPDSVYGGGYDGSQFDPEWGFKANLNPKFPTTGFRGASFTFIMKGDPTDYTFTHNGGLQALTTQGKVILNSKPSGAVTITARYKWDPSQVHTYTFNPTTVWVEPYSNNYTLTYSSAISQCGGSSKIPTRAQLTNSPQRFATNGTNLKTNYYTRKIGGGVLGEWGYVDNVAYPNSNWINNWYWTREQDSSNNQRFLVSFSGDVQLNKTGSPRYVACLK
ncbi:hypothetical protein RCS94_08395 [Orbaceae bacterium ac157xtp]